MAESTKTVYIDHTNGGKETTDIDPKQVDFLLSQGYISKKGGNKEDFGRTATAPAAKDDPTLAANREAPVAPNALKPHVSNMESPGGETTLGKDRGLDAAPKGAHLPKVKVTSDKDAGK